jgi:eukaryotic-like serine/threonine-protein kinase
VRKPGRVARAPGKADLATRAAREYGDRSRRSPAAFYPVSRALATGTAGIAYFLFRHGTVSGDERSLDAAERWLSRQDDGAFLDERAEDGLLESSVYYGEPGIWWVRALVAAFRDPRSAGAVGERFGDAARFASPRRDITYGPAGMLLGLAALVEALHEVEGVATLRSAGDAVAADISASAGDALISEHDELGGYLGVAHGWAGLAHALIRWSSARSQPPPELALGLLDRLLYLRRPSGRWPRRIGERRVYRGWCNGSAGWAQLWSAAWAATGEEKMLRLAEAAAEDAVAADDDVASLCCGRAGEAFAALTLFRTTGEKRWLDAAKRVAVHAAAKSDTDEGQKHELFHGRLGVALLMLELEDPGRSAMPVSEAIV